MAVFRAGRTRVALLAVGASGIVSSLLYFAQGGFGGGHGRFDLAIFALGLPWDLVIGTLPDTAWPALFRSNDYSWLIATPLLLNLSAVLAISTLVRRLRRRTRAKRRAGADLAL